MQSSWGRGGGMDEGLIIGNGRQMMANFVSTYALFLIPKNSSDCNFPRSSGSWRMWLLFNINFCRCFNWCTVDNPSQVSRSCIRSQMFFRPCVFTYSQDTSHISLGSAMSWLSLKLRIVRSTRRAISRGTRLMRFPSIKSVKSGRICT